VDNPNSSSTKDNDRILKSNIISLYRVVAWKEICLLEKSRIKIERRESNFQIINDCRDRIIRQNSNITMDNLNSSSTKNNHKSLKSNIISLYGEDAWKMICLLEKSSLKIERRALDLQFLKYFCDRNIRQNSNITVDNMNSSFTKNNHRSVRSNKKFDVYL